MATDEHWKIICLAGVQESDERITLKVTADDHIIFSSRNDQPIHYNDLRWVAKKPFLILKETQKSTAIILSYMNVQTQTIEYQIFEVVVPKDGFSTKTADCFCRLQKIILKKLEASSHAEGHVNNIFKEINSQPIFINKVDVLINYDDMPDDWDGEYSNVLVILDLECLCVLMGPSDKHHIFFWIEEDPKSVDIVRSFPGQYISIKTKTSEYRFKQCDNGFDKIIRQLKPTKKYLFIDIEAMTQMFKQGGYMAPCAQWPAASSSEGLRYKPPKGNEASGWNTEASGWNTEASGWNTEASGWNTGAYSNDGTTSVESTLVESLRSELVAAIETFKDNDEFQNIWITMEYDIKDIMDSGRVPLTDGYSGGLDPDSAEHLEKCFRDIEDQFKENNLPVAISRLRACKELYSTSTNSTIRCLVALDDLYLLKGLYMKSLQS
ncbi:hypothetical protein ACF0H5_013168 [Mactra antiquata]